MGKRTETEFCILELAIDAICHKAKNEAGAKIDEASCQAIYGQVARVRVLASGREADECIECSIIDEEALFDISHEGYLAESEMSGLGKEYANAINFQRKRAKEQRRNESLALLEMAD